MEIKQEIDELLNALSGGSTDQTDEKGGEIDEGQEEEKAEEKTQEPEEEAAAQGEDVDGDDTADDEGEDAEEDEEEEESKVADETAEEIRRSVMEMIAKAQQQQQAVLNSPTQQPQQQQTTTQQQQVPVQPTFDLSDDDVEEAMTSPEKFKEVVKRVYEKAIEDAMRSIIPSVNAIVSQQMAIKTAVDNFYRENEDLVPYKEFVGFVANVVASEHPDWDVPRVLQETAKISRQKLLLDKRGTNKKKKKKTTGAYKPNSARPAPQKLSKLEQEILELISD